MKSSALLAVSIFGLCILSACGSGSSNPGGGASQVATHFALTVPAWPP
jgi:hypothetical protein